MYVCVCSRVREGDMVTQPRLVCKHIRASYRVCHATLFPFQAWTDGKTKDIINCLYFSFESWSSRLWKGSYISDAACGVRPITMHCASWPIRADCACRKDGLCRNQSVWERRGIEDLQKCTVFEKLCVFFSGGPLSALTCCVNARLLSAIKKISPLIYSQSWVGSWVYTTQDMMTFTLIF